MNAIQKLKSANIEGKYICVGLDTDHKKLPAHLSTYKNPVIEFNKRIIEATSDSAAAYKLNLAFYESEGASGIEICMKLYRSSLKTFLQSLMEKEVT